MNPYEDDVNNLIESYRINGYSITSEQAEDIWSEYSEELFASWMMMGDDLNKLFKSTEKYAKVLKII